MGTLTRYYAPSQLVASNDRINDMFLKLTANPAQGKGGTCFGDSGGADFLGNTNIILGVNSFVTNGNCAGVTIRSGSTCPKYSSGLRASSKTSYSPSDRTSQVLVPLG